MDRSLSRVARALARGQGLALRGALRMPPPVRRAVRGAPVRRNGLTLDRDIQLMLRLIELSRPPELCTLTPAAARRRVAADVVSVAGRPVEVASVRDVWLADGISGRLYVPLGAAPGLLVYFHGGGFVVGSAEVWDPAVRGLAAASGVRVLSVDYRRAPEHPFPAAADDAWSAWCAAVARAAEFGAHASAMAVGGDSAGGNLAAGVALRAAGEGGPAPRLQLLIYPWLELAERSRSRQAFAEGFYLTDDDLTWYASHYLGSPGTEAADPRASPLRSASFDGVAPAYIATAGFDPLRDEGEAYAARLRAAGVPVVLRRHAGLIHGYFNTAAIIPAARDALHHAAGAVALALTEGSVWRG